MSPSQNRPARFHVFDTIHGQTDDTTAIQTQRNLTVAALDPVTMKVRVAVGNLGQPFPTLAGDFGLAVQDPQGNIHEVNPATDGSVFGGYSTSSATYVDLGFPSVSAHIGASGSAILLASALITTGAAAQGGIAAVEVDGVVPGSGSQVVQAYATSSSVQLSVAASWVQSGMTAGAAHTFKMVYRSTVGGTNATFSQNNLIVWPI
jgi:hypothetical protein